MTADDPTCRALLRDVLTAEDGPRVAAVLADWCEGAGRDAEAGLLRRGLVPLGDADRAACVGLFWCRYGAGTWDKRFAADVCAAVRERLTVALSVRQLRQVWRMAWSYRGQLRRRLPAGRWAAVAARLAWLRGATVGAAASPVQRTLFDADPCEASAMLTVRLLAELWTDGERYDMEQEVPLPFPPCPGLLIDLAAGAPRYEVGEACWCVAREAFECAPAGGAPGPYRRCLPDRKSLLAAVGGLVACGFSVARHTGPSA